MTWPSHDLTPQQTSRHQNTSLQSTKHHHHGTAEGSFTAKKWFGHRAGRSPCAHSIGKFFLCYIVLILLETSAPGLSGHYWYYVYSLAILSNIHYICIKTPIMSLSHTLQNVSKCHVLTIFQHQFEQVWHKALMGVARSSKKSHLDEQQRMDRTRDFYSRHFWVFFVGRRGYRGWQFPYMFPWWYHQSTVFPL